MTSRFLAALTGVGLALAAAGTAEAQIRLDRPVGGGGAPPQQQPAQPGGLVTAVTPPQLIAALQQAGYARGEVLQLQNGLKGIKLDLNGTPVFVLFYSCQGEQCGSFTYYCFFGQQSVDATFVNAFNRERRFGKLYTDKEGALGLSMDVNMIGGVSPAYVAGSGALFSNVIKWLIEFKPE